MSSPLGAIIEPEGKGHILEMSGQRDNTNGVTGDLAAQGRHTSASAYPPGFDGREINLPIQVTVKGKPTLGPGI